jgi:hypothetical protein
VGERQAGDFTAPTADAALDVGAVDGERMASAAGALSGVVP